MLTDNLEAKIPRQKTRLATSITRLERNITKAKDLIEAAPLVPTWNIHKYIPATRNIGAEYRRENLRRI